MLSLCLNFLEL